VLVRTTEDGRRLGSARITNSPAAVRQEIGRAGERSDIAGLPVFALVCLLCRAVRAETMFPG
jgi:hypothetical protein